MSRSNFFKVAGIVSILLAMTFAAYAQNTLPPTVSTMIPFAQDNGFKPEASLIQYKGTPGDGLDGNLYGTTYYGGRFNEGAVIGMTPAGGLTQLPANNGSYVIYSFDSFACGNWPVGPVVQASDGNLYGTTSAGGNDHVGAIFMVNPKTGDHYCVHGFSTKPTDGHSPEAGLIQVKHGPYAGMLAGTTSEGGEYGGGILFIVSLDGNEYDVLWNFNNPNCSPNNAQCPDGKHPRSALVEDDLGNLYGTTAAGGIMNQGTSWELCTASALQCGGLPLDDGQANYWKLADLTSTTTGSYPDAPLVFGPTDGTGDPSDGELEPTTHWLFGTTTTDGPLGLGTGYGAVFTVAPCVHGEYDPPVFPPCATQDRYTFGSVGNDGKHPHAHLLLAADGYFYGTTRDGGSNSGGAVYRMTNTGGLYKVLYSFDGSQGAHPRAGLLQGTNGYFYGTAEKKGVADDGKHDGTAFNLSPVPEKFVAVTPCRLLDTRTTGNQGITGLVSYNLRELAKLNNCEDLSHADSYALNVTIVPTFGPVGYVTLWPENSPLGQPNASTLNSYNAVTKAAAPIVLGGWDTGAQAPHQGISVFASDQTDFIIDLQGYFSERQHVPDHGQTLQFYPLTPCRVVDTRQASFPPLLGAPSLVGNMIREFPMMASPCFSTLNGDPPVAYSLNLTVVPQGPLWYLTAWAGGESQPNVSNLNDGQAVVLANAAIVAAGTGADGPVRVYASNNTDVVIDVNGYYDVPGSGGDYYSGVPCRAEDTRIQSPYYPYFPISGGTAETFDIGYLGDNTKAVPTSSCTPFVPVSGPLGYAANTTVVPFAPLGYLSLYPTGDAQPVVSTLNSYDGTVTSNAAIVPNLAGMIDAFASDNTNFILDLSGYFNPPSGMDEGSRLLVVKNTK